MLQALQRDAGPGATPDRDARRGAAPPLSELS